MTNDLVRAIASAANIDLPDSLRGGEGAMTISTPPSSSANSSNVTEPDGIEGDHLCIEGGL